MKRALIFLLPFSLALGIALVAGYALLAARPSPLGGTSETADAVRLHGEVDSETQEQLMEILRAADSSGDR